MTPRPRLSQSWRNLAVLTAVSTFGFSATARAECRPGPGMGEIVCDSATLDLIRHESESCRRDLRIAHADKALAEARVVALTKRLVVAETPTPPGTDWRTVALVGAGAVLVGFAAGVLLASVAR